MRITNSFLEKGWPWAGFHRHTGDIQTSSYFYCMIWVYCLALPLEYLRGFVPRIIQKGVKKDDFVGLAYEMN
jgi:hypothetical protein